MRFDVVTLLPELFEQFGRAGVVGRAIAADKVQLNLHNPREFGLGRHRSVDDTPYGGGPGMVMRVDCVVKSLESIESGGPRILLSPRGRTFDQTCAQRLAALPAITLVCGRYEGIDGRIHTFVDEEISLGDFVMSGGEIAALAIIDACARLRPEVLGNASSLLEESHSPDNDGLLEYPHYTRPAEFRDVKVPAVLTGGNHKLIEAWRRKRSIESTCERRPDLIPEGKKPCEK